MSTYVSLPAWCAVFPPRLATVINMAQKERFDVAVVGGGPAGLMAAEMAATEGARVIVIEAGRTPGRKFLLAGRSGLNLTHSEPFDRFISRYGTDQVSVRPMLEHWGPDALQQWSASLGEPCTVGSSGRVFPASWRAAPLLRAWLRRLDALGVTLQTSTRWTGFVENGPAVTVVSADGPATVETASMVLACGGASWPRTGSDGTWVRQLSPFGVLLRPWAAANAGLLLLWTSSMRRFEGEPLKGVALHSPEGQAIRGDLVIVSGGLQGTPAYSISSAVGRALAATGVGSTSGRESIAVALDLRPDLSVDELAHRLARRKKGESLAHLLRRVAGLRPVAIAIANEFSRPPSATNDLARYLKSVPLVVVGTEPIDHAISTSGGLAWSAVDENLAIIGLDQVFAAGEMIAWDAPTGGYLLQASFSTGVWAGQKAAAAATAAARRAG